MSKKKHTIQREKINGKYWIVERNQEGKITSKIEWTSNKAELDKRINLVSKSREKEYWNERIEKSTQKELDAFEQLKQMSKEVQKYKTTEEAKALINKTKTIHIGRTEIQTDGKVNLHEAEKIYKNILAQKVENKDEIPEIIKHREKLLQNRLLCTIELYTKKGLIGVINVGGILLEKDIYAEQFWKGRIVDSNEFYPTSDRFKEILGNPRIYTENQTSIQAGEITDVRTNWSFA